MAFSGLTLQRSCSPSRPRVLCRSNCISRNLPPLVCFKARDSLAVGIKQRKVLPSDLPTFNLLQDLKKCLLGVHAFETSHQSAGRAAEGKTVAFKGVTADQLIASSRPTYSR